MSYSRHQNEWLSLTWETHEEKVGAEGKKVPPRRGLHMDHDGTSGEGGPLLLYGLTDPGLFWGVWEGSQPGCVSFGRLPH